MYEAGQGYPDFDPEKAATYFQRVNERMAELIRVHIERWDLAGIYR